MEDFIDEKTKGPLRALSVHLQKVWPSIEPAVDKMEDLFRFYYTKLQGGSFPHKITIETLEFGKRSFAIGIFAKEIIRSCANSLFSTVEARFSFNSIIWCLL